MYTRSYEHDIVRPPYPFEFKKFIVARGELLSTARKYLKRRKKTLTRFYNKREHTAEALEVHHAGSLLFFFSIFVPQTKIKSFFVKDLIDHAKKVYKVRKLQTLTYID